MKKLLIMLALSTLNVSMLNAKPETSFGPNEPDGKAVKTEKVRVLNMTGRPIFAAVYIQESDNKEAPLFGDIYSIADETQETLLRPNWNGLARLLGGKDRKLYFTFDRGELTTSLTPAAVPRKNDQFIKVGNSEGNEFVIYAIDENKKPNITGQTPKAAKMAKWAELSEKFEY